MKLTWVGYAALVLLVANAALLVGNLRAARGGSITANVAGIVAAVVAIGMSRQSYRIRERIRVLRRFNESD